MNDTVLQKLSEEIDTLLTARYDDLKMRHDKAFLGARMDRLNSQEMRVDLIVDAVDKIITEAVTEAVKDRISAISAKLAE